MEQLGFNTVRYLELVGGNILHLTTKASP